MQHQINAKEVKEKILKFLEQKGPSLPVPVAKHIELNSIFASAFLSELAEEGHIGITDMKIGGSPLYLLPSKIPLLENFINNLGQKEREACLLLKEKGILQDDQQTPVIRVALRGIRDFAIPYKRDNKIFWRYFLHKEEAVALEPPEPPKAVKIEEKAVLSKVEEKPTLPEVKESKPAEPINNTELQEVKKELEEKMKELQKMKEELSEKNKAPIKLNPIMVKKTEKRLAAKDKQKRSEEKFLNEVKELIAARKIELIKLEQFDRKQVFAIININNGYSLLAAFDKKKVEDSDLLKAHKKASALKLPYIIFSKGEPSKKTKEAIEAYKNLSSIEIMEQFDNSLKQQSF